MFKTLYYCMARSFSETACQPNPGRSRPHSLGPMPVGSGRDTNVVSAGAIWPGLNEPRNLVL